MNHASLFSGIGGFDLAAEWAGWTNVLNCEIDPFCQNELKNHWPNAKQYSDIRKTDFTIWRGRIDVLTGGFPCQPFSVAGKRKGTDDDRHLWPEMLRAIREIAPRWVVGENVRGIVNWNGGMVFEQVCADLEAENYSVQPFVLPACGANAPHQRYRCWFVAYSDNNGSHGSENRQGMGAGNDRRSSGANEAEQSAGCADSYAVVTQNPNDIRRNGFESEEKSGFGQFGQSGTGNNGRIRSDDGKVGFASNRSNSRAETLQEPEIGVLSDRDAANAASAGNYWQNFPTQSPIFLGDDGFPAELVRQRIREDSMGLLSEKEINKIISKALGKVREESIKGAGNAVVPPLVYQIFDTINRYEKLMRNT